MTNGFYNNEEPLNKGEIRFYDNYIPPLGSGNFIIDVTQQVSLENTDVKESGHTSQIFSVEGPRYAIPPEDIFSTFPPNNAQGIFEQFLPHVVLTKQTLPWERDIFNDGNQPAGQSPWLALLLFVEGEKIGGSDALLPPKVNGWKPNPNFTAALSAREMCGHGKGDKILWPDLKAEWYEKDEFLKSTMCNIIDISPQAFRTLVPEYNDLKWLAHVRQVNPADKDSSVLKVCGDGWYSVITGNRLPDAPPRSGNQPAGRCIAHLVSLEGLEKYVKDKSSLPADIERVRMISFKSWTFTCQPQMGESFSQLMNHLITERNGSKKTTVFSLPIKEEAFLAEEYNYAVSAVNDGYVPLTYQTRLGEQTFAWYRGPFSPVPVQNTMYTIDRGFDTASSAIIYDPKYGIFDVSYGVAWETGRLLALSDQNFGMELLEWQRNGHHKVDLMLERKAQASLLEGFHKDNSDGKKPLGQLLKPYAASDSFVTYLLTQFSDEIAPKIYGSPSQTAPTQEEPTDSGSPMRFADLNPILPDSQSIEEFVNTEAIQDTVCKLGAEGIDKISEWLGKLYLLENVPFENLVPHSDMLPEESIRFFYIDPNWLFALMEGALSIGIESSRDKSYQNLMKEHLLERSFNAAREIRNTLLGRFSDTIPKSSGVSSGVESMAGMLLRSSVVSGWPGMEVNAYGGTKMEGGHPKPDLSTYINPLRLERLSSDVILCIWPSVPAMVTIDEPHEGVEFGFEDPPKEKGKGYYLYLRSIDKGNYGKPLVPEEKYMLNAEEEGIIGDYRIIKINGSGGLIEAIQKKIPVKPHVGIHDFAIEMVKVPEQIVFAAQPQKNASGATARDTYEERR